MLGKVASAIGEAEGTIGAIDLVEVGERLVRDVTVDAADADHWDDILGGDQAVEGAHVVDSTDRTFLLHVGGKIALHNKSPLKAARRPVDGVHAGRRAGVQRDRAGPGEGLPVHDQAQHGGRRQRRTAVLGLGDIGPRAAMPVMEGKAMLFKEFAGVDAFPICLDTKDTEEIIERQGASPRVRRTSTLRTSVPTVLEIEDRLKAELDIPVFHDDQHGTAIVVMAALFNA